jgi:hypothetical protein
MKVVKYKQNITELFYLHSLFHVIMSQIWINCKWTSKPDEWRVNLIMLRAQLDLIPIFMIKNT